jgi:hypothetical protein
VVKIRIAASYYHQQPTSIAYSLNYSISSCVDKRFSQAARVIRMQEQPTTRLSSTSEQLLLEVFEASLEQSLYRILEGNRDDHIRKSIVAFGNAGYLTIGGEAALLDFDENLDASVLISKYDIVPGVAVRIADNLRRLRNEKSQMVRQKIHSSYPPPPSTIRTTTSSTTLRLYSKNVPDCVPIVVPETAPFLGSRTGPPVHGDITRLVSRRNAEFTTPASASVQHDLPSTTKGGDTTIGRPNPHQSTTDYPLLGVDDKEQADRAVDSDDDFDFIDVPRKSKKSSSFVPPVGIPVKRMRMGRTPDTFQRKNNTRCVHYYVWW